MDDKQPHIQLGIMSGVYRDHPLMEAARRIRAAGFAVAQLDFAFADEGFRAINTSVARRVADAFGEHGVRIAGISGYTNLIEPDKAKRTAAIARFQDILRCAPHFGTRVVVSQTGSRSTAGMWAGHPDNHGAEAWEQFTVALREAVKVAEDHGVEIALECSVLNTVYNIDRAEQLFSEIDSPSLTLLMDPCNFFDQQNLGQMTRVLEEMFARLGHKASLAHAKDVKLENGSMTLPRSGQGVLDYPAYLRLLKKHKPGLPLIIEHLTELEVGETKQFVEAQLRALESSSL